ncbi:Outer membrane usher protein sefC [Granulibacter bethesdensis]|uniref:Outer membrane usher protein sefC n=1 Tax=Granulibacter bethesdensis TaxID=364410 RepID=A0AAN0RE07_9PROT|nr:fimbria/pilus outer membrane usher protein [Granulibacter bethesdensis]AHJ63139.1 Outer membrane usher protein sefC [Granulibacter bethesdensis]
MILFRFILSFLFFIFPFNTTAFAADIKLLLDVIINGSKIQKIGEFVEKNNTLYASGTELTELGLKIRPSSQTSDLLALKNLDGIKFTLNQSTQTIHIIAEEKALLPALLTASPKARSDMYQGSTGFNLSYDIQGSMTGNVPYGTGSFIARAFSHHSLFSSSQTVYAGLGPAGAGSVSVIRQDTTYTYSNPQTLRRYRFGDVIGGSLLWTRPIKLGGIQIATDFSMQPENLPFPVPSVAGLANGPSRINVLMNGLPIFNQQISSGPFEISRLPVMTGASELTSIITGLNGQRTTTTIPFYASPLLLKKNLSSLSAEAGFLRRYWGTLYSEYDNFAGSATYRYGISSHLTLEGHVEASQKVIETGIGADWNCFNLGIVSMTMAGSNAGGGSGTQESIGFQRNGRHLSFGFSELISDSKFRDLARLTGSPVPKKQLNAYIGYSFQRLGSINLSYNQTNLYSMPISLSYYVPPGTFNTSNMPIPGTTITAADSGLVTLQPAQKTEILSINYSLQVGKVSLYATVFNAISGGGGYGAFFGMSIPLGNRSSASVNSGAGQSRPYQQIQVNQTANVPGDFGYQLNMSHGNQSIQTGTVNYKSRIGTIYGGIDHIGATTTYRGEIQGAISYINGGFFLSNQIFDSFAVVDTSGLPNIHVYSNNRLMGQTDSNGLLLLPDLNSFTDNKISIDPGDVPLDADLASIDYTVRPMDHTGMVIPFRIKTTMSALIHFVTPNGVPLSLGSSVQLTPPSPIGYDGSAYLTGLKPGNNRVKILLSNGQKCYASFNYVFVPATIPTIGPIPCTQQ